MFHALMGRFQEAEGTKRPVENVALTTKGKKENTTCERDNGGKIGDQKNFYHNITYLLDTVTF